MLSFSGRVLYVEGDSFGFLDLVQVTFETQICGAYGGCVWPLLHRGQPISVKQEVRLS